METNPSNISLNHKEDVWIIDTDYSYDDQIAISYLAKHLNIIAITLVHRVPKVDLNILAEKVKNDLIKIGKEKIQVFIGSENPYIDYVKDLNDDEIMDPYSCNNATEKLEEENDLKKFENLALENKQKQAEKIEKEKDGSDFITNIAAVKLIELINMHGNNLNILSLGPLTNLSLAVILDINIKNAFKNLFIMGGSIYNYGNSGNCSEYNFRCDPVAAKNVIGNFSNIRLLSLEIDHKLKENNKEFVNAIMDLIEQSEKISIKRDYLVNNYSNFLKNFLEVYSRNDEDNNFHESLFGLIAALFILNPNLIDKKLMKKLPSDIDIFGRKTRGCNMIQNYEHLVDGKFNDIDMISDFDINEMIKTMKEFLI